MASNSNGKITFWERFSYGCGDLGCNIIYSAMSAFLLFYYTDYVHVDAVTIGTIMLLSRVFDGVTDLIMGVIVPPLFQGLRLFRHIPCRACRTALRLPDRYKVPPVSR